MADSEQHTCILGPPPQCSLHSRWHRGNVTVNLPCNLSSNSVSTQTDDTFKIESYKWFTTERVLLSTLINPSENKRHSWGLLLCSVQNDWSSLTFMKIIVTPQWIWRHCHLAWQTFYCISTAGNVNYVNTNAKPDRCGRSCEFRQPYMGF